jgi:NAD(P)-dependent dehydrogenase (short-subunit alcohol dehydrogenase family)
MTSTNTSTESKLLLAGKTALVTGGTTGIGRATAELFHAHGARVAVTGQDGARLAQARAELPRDVVVIRADARSIADADALARRIEAEFGGLDVVFLNAGIAKLAPFAAVDEAFYAEHMDVNVKGVVFTLQKLLPLLRPGASVITNTSIAGQRAAPHMSIYSATKGAVSSLTRTLAAELAPRQIRVNAISPGMIRTAIQGKFGLPPEVAAASERMYSARMPLGRFGDANEVSGLALFLASDASSFVTGTEIPVDGGLTAT